MNNKITLTFQSSLAVASHLMTHIEQFLIDNDEHVEGLEAHLTGFGEPKE